MSTESASVGKRSRRKTVFFDDSDTPAKKRKPIGPAGRRQTVCQTSKTTKSSTTAGGRRKTVCHERPRRRSTTGASSKPTKGTARKRSAKQKFSSSSLRRTPSPPPKPLSPLPRLPSPPPPPPKACALCHQTGTRPLIKCTQCKINRVHVDCLRAESDHYNEAEAATWECVECATCPTCYETTIIGTMYKCVLCFRFYHAECNELNDRPAPLQKLDDSNRIRCAQCLHSADRERMLNDEDDAAAAAQQQDKAFMPPPVGVAQQQQPQQQQKQQQPQQHKPPPATQTVAVPKVPSLKTSKWGFAGFSESDLLRPRPTVFVVEDATATEDDEDDAEEEEEGDGGEDVAAAAAAPAAFVVAASPPPLRASVASQMDIVDADTDMDIEEDFVVDTEPLPPPPPPQQPLTVPSSSSNSSNMDTNITITTNNNNSSSTSTAAAASTNVVDGWSPLTTLATAAEMAASRHQDAEVPDASCWTVDEVHAYFGRFFGEKDASVMFDEAIDGRALLLLQRHDVLRLRVRLGVALNMYWHVVRLQNRSERCSFMYT